jgi:ABC-type transport system involved in multi-copper enzyme maturation permease subunit
MATRAIKPKRDNTLLTGWQSMPEQAPSVVRAETPTVARFLGMVGVALTAVGLLAQVSTNYAVGPGWGGFFLSIGVVLLLYHAFVDKEIQFRRAYMVGGLVLAAIGLFLRIVPVAGTTGGAFLPYGIFLLMLALLFLLAVLRNEDSPLLHNVLLRVVGVLGALMIFAGLVIGQFRPDFLAGEGLVLLILGLLYVGAFIGMQDVGSDAGYYAALALGAAGGLTIVITLLRLLALARFGNEGAATEFLVPSGLALIGVSVVYVAVALAVCTDWTLVVLIRRELAAFFYSPMAYLVLVAMMLVSWFNFLLFLDNLLPNPRSGFAFEPIVVYYILSFIPVVAQLFVVPVLTMRLLSEEKRTGTLEMLLTAPVNESTVLLSKFFAAWFFYLLTWVPTWLFLVSMRALGAEEFDYRPLLSFFFALAASSAGFIAMGLFFSSVTRNQIIAAVLTFVGMTLFLLTYFLGHSREIEGTVWGDVFYYGSFIDLWISSLQGVLALRYLVFHLSVAVFFLFLTDKVLEARKWS